MAGAELLDISCCDVFFSYVLWHWWKINLNLYRYSVDLGEAPWPLPIVSLTLTRLLIYLIALYSNFSLDRKNGIFLDFDFFYAIF